jgi:hypothetical protein
VKFLVAAVALALSVLAPAATPAPSETAEHDLLDLDPTNFDNPTVIDNEWMPLRPGTRLVYDGFDVDDNGQRIPHVVFATTTDLTKVINGVRTRVILEEDYSDEELVEKDIAFHAQDNDGNVWHFGELVETYEGAAFLGGHVWLVGLTEGAHAGIQMLAEPEVGETYRSLVHRMGLRTTVPSGTYEDVMVIAEWDQETEEGVFQDKYYARRVGVVRIGFRGPDPTGEELELIGIEQLSPEELADLRRDVLRMEERAYLYGQTSPVETE